MDRIAAGFAEIGEIFSAVVNAYARAVGELAGRVVRGLRAQAEQDRRDRDDELDWLGGYQGRRDR